MNKLISCLFAASLGLVSYSALAATNSDNKDDASTLGTSDTPQVKNQDMVTNSATSDKTVSEKHSKKHHKMKVKNKTQNNETAPTSNESAPSNI